MLLFPGATINTGLDLEAFRARRQPERSRFYAVSSFLSCGIPGNTDLFSQLPMTKKTDTHLGDGKSNLNTGCKSYFQTSFENNTKLSPCFRGLST